MVVVDLQQAPKHTWWEREGAAARRAHRVGRERLQSRANTHLEGVEGQAVDVVVMADVVPGGLARRVPQVPPGEGTTVAAGRGMAFARACVCVWERERGGGCGDRGSTG